MYIYIKHEMYGAGRAPAGDDEVLLEVLDERRLAVQALEQVLPA